MYIKPWERFEIAAVNYADRDESGGRLIDRYLEDCWEPFAATEHNHGSTIWFRRVRDAESSGLRDSS